MFQSPQGTSSPSVGKATTGLAVGDVCLGELWALKVLLHGLLLALCCQWAAHTHLSLAGTEPYVFFSTLPEVGGALV